MVTIRHIQNMIDWVPVCQYIQQVSDLCLCIKCRYDASKVNILVAKATTPMPIPNRKFERLYLQKYSELQSRILHAFIIRAKGILGIFGNIGDGHLGAIG